MQQHPHRARARRRRRNRIIPALAVVGLAAMNSVAADVAVADEPTVTWSVSPADADGPDGRAWVELELDPGETATEHLAVRNLSAEEITFGLAAADGYFTDTGRFNMFSSDRESTDAGTWITVEDTVTVAPNGTAVLPFEVEVPENAPPGDHAAGVAASITSVSADPDGTRLGVESRVGFRVMTRVTGELQPKLDVVAVDATYDTSWNPFEPGAIRIATRWRTAGTCASTSPPRPSWAIGVPRSRGRRGLSTRRAPARRRTGEGDRAARRMAARIRHGTGRARAQVVGLDGSAGRRNPTCGRCSCGRCRGHTC